MKYYSFKEKTEHITNGLSYAYYPVDKYNPKYQMMHHWHKEFELILIRKGKFTLKLDNNTKVLNEGDFAIISPGVIHGGIAEDAVYECLVFSADALKYDKTNKRVLPSQIIVNTDFGEYSNTIKEYIDKAFFSVKHRTIGFDLRFYSSILNIFATILENNLYTKSSERNNKFLAFENTIKFIEENYSRNITLDELAKNSNLSRKYFSEYFKKITGKGPIEYINKFRIEQACQMLIDTNLNITEIALDCGFNNLSYFIKAFKEEKNITPTKYRKAFK